MSDLNTAANQFFDRREAMRPSVWTWVKHSFLLLATLATITIAGVLQPFGIISIIPTDDPQSWNEIFQFLLSLPGRYIHLIFNAVSLLFTEPYVFKHGISFSVSLLAILLAHEFGHYIACRLYGVDATLPYFIPTPPLIGPAGTFGAFIKIVSPLPSRRATFDIGVAGPIAGFLTLIPVAFIGFLTHQQDLSQNISEIPDGAIVFADPLLFKFLAWTFGINLQAVMLPNPFYAAAWIGLLVTALNLVPSGQLDGGHAIHAIFGEKFHKWTGRIAFIAAVVLSLLGWFLYSSPSGFLFAILLGVMMRVSHPEPLDDTPLDLRRKVIAVLTVLIFILSFTPFPIQIL
jgi:membrane-associated protease RseP (regulator of RpoE activity)